MSAIAGLYNLNNEEPVAIDYRNGMMKALEKFPADDIQVWQKGPVFLGCHAQWITPESIGEKLPFYDSERKCAITADCIIDNREELFEALQVPREDQRTIPDSLLILLAYYKWGEDCPKHLIGDFAFMIWDERERKMFGARDFSGGRTLYYFYNGKQFVFCTLIKPILTLPYIKNEINEEWIAEFLAITGMVDAVDTTITPYKNIQQLSPSHSINIKQNRIEINRYCYLEPKVALKLKSDYEYVEAFQDVFHKAVKSRLRTHKAVGAQLSGGLDSGAIASFAVKELKCRNQPLYTFSYVPEGDFVDFTPDYIEPNESQYIKRTVDFVGGIKDYYLDFQGKDSYTEIDSFLETMEMPYKFFENSFWMNGMFEEAQKKNVGILLNGGRGNLTISWGSALDFYGYLLRRFKWIKLVKELDQYSKKVGGSRLRRLPTVAKTAFPKSNYRSLTQNSSQFPVMINSDFAKRTKVFQKLKLFGFDEVGWFASDNIFKHKKRHFQDTFHWNASNTLATKFSLKHGLWKRDPTNDLQVIQFCLQVPEEQFVQNGSDRSLVRRATKNLLPDEIRLNYSIRGVQGADWVHRMKINWDSFVHDIESMIQNERLGEFVDRRVLFRGLEKVKGKFNPNFILDPDSKVLMRSLVVYKFLSQLERR